MSRLCTLERVPGVIECIAHGIYKLYMLMANFWIEFTLVKQADNDKEAGSLIRTTSITGKNDQGKVLDFISTKFIVGTEVLT